MKRLLFFLVLSVLNSAEVFCQKDSSYHYLVEYEMILNLGSLKSYKANLYYNEFNSLFEYKEQFEEKSQNENENIFRQDVTVQITKDSILYINSNRQKNYIREYLGNVFNNISYEVEEPIPIIDWSIYDVTKKFNSHHCIKATCSFRGRNYTVWFTTDIQTSFGPLKLHGLPGLILEANDDTNEVILRAKSISITEMKIKEQNPYLKVFSHKDVNDQIQKILDKLEESAKVISSKMDRGMKAKFEISRPKAIEMDFNFTPKKK